MQAFAPCSCLKGACAEHTNWGSRGKKVQKRDNSDSLDECWFTAHVSARRGGIVVEGGFPGVSAPDTDRNQPRNASGLLVQGLHGPSFSVTLLCQACDWLPFRAGLSVSLESANIAN